MTPPTPTPLLICHPGSRYPTVSKAKAHPQRWRFITTKTAPWDSWMASPTQWTWVWANSGRSWRTGAWLAIVLQSGSWLRDWTAPTKSAPELWVRPWTNKHGTQGKTLLGCFHVALTMSQALCGALGMKCWRMHSHLPGRVSCHPGAQAWLWHN